MTRRAEAASVADFVLRKIGFVLAAAAGTFLMFPGIVHAADTWEPDATPGTGVVFAADGGWMDRSIDAEGDEDWFSLPVEAGKWYSIEARPTSADEWVDMYLEVFDTRGSLIAEDDDSGVNLMPKLLFQSTTTDTLDVKLRGYSIFTTGAYSARAQEVVPAALSGRVTSPEGDPLADVTVALYLFHDGIWRDAGTTLSSHSGDYSFEDLAAGKYRLSFSMADTLFPVIYYPGVQSATMAEDLILDWGDSAASINQRMQTSALVSGTVQNWNGSLPMTDVRVSVYANTAEGYQKVTSFSTNSVGSWAGRLVEGTYRFEYNDRDAIALTIFHPDASSLALAQDVQVGPEGVSLSAKMPQSTNLSGTVSDATTGDPIANAVIDAYRVTASGLEYLDGASSADDGSYEVETYTGTYVLSARTNDRSHLAFVNAAPEEIMNGTRISIGPSGATLDFQLVPAATITGTVFALTTDDPVPNAEVQAQVLRKGEWTNAGAAETASEDGSFAILGLAEGTYRLRATHPDAPSARWYSPGVSAAGAAQAFEVPAGASVPAQIGVSDDTVAPTTALTGEDQVAPLTLTLQATDNGTGVAKTYYRVDGSEWTVGSEIVIHKAGYHVIEFYSEDRVGNTEAIRSSDIYAYETSVDVSTLAGSNRYQTAVAVSKDAFPEGASAVVIASGRTWADGLSAAALAGALDAPILLVPQNSVPGEVAGEIARLDPDTAWIVGGEGVVGPEIGRFLTSAIGSTEAVTRLGGANRYQTAAMVANELVDTLAATGETWDGTYILASGSNFPDALAVSPVAASMNWPIVLTGPNGLNATTAEFLRTSGAKDGIALGGDGAIHRVVIEEATRITHGELTRVAGTDRYLTALAIAKYAQEHADLGTGDIAVASGQSFPDALTSGVRQARNGSILVLTPTGTLHPGVANFLQGLDPETARRVTFVGGVAAVSQEARASVLGALAH